MTSTKHLPEVVLGAAPTNITVETDLNKLEWHKTVDGKQVLVSTRRDLIDLEYVSTVFDPDHMPWAKATTKEGMQKMLDNSITFGLYVAESIETAQRYKQIGMARLISDHVTFAYLTDVLVNSEHRRYGHAKWLLACCRQVMEGMPILRRGVLLTSLPYGRAFYKETLGFYDVEEDPREMYFLTGLGEATQQA